MTDFEAMDKMAKENKNIRMCGQLVSANLAKGGGHVTMGVPSEIITDLSFSDDFVAVLYVIDKKQFFDIKGSNH